MTDATLAERLGSLRLAVSDAAAEAGRSVDDITTIAVTKFHPAALIRDLVELGVHDIAENRHQEARDKAAELSGRLARLDRASRHGPWTRQTLDLIAGRPEVRA